MNRTPRVLSCVVWHGRVELSLKLAAPGAAELADLAEGDTVRGTVRKLEHFGVFVRLHNSSLTGLAHKSQLADAFVADPAAAFQVGQGAARTLSQGGGVEAAPATGHAFTWRFLTQLPVQSGVSNLCMRSYQSLQAHLFLALQHVKALLQPVEQLGREAAQPHPCLPQTQRARSTAAP